MIEVACFVFTILTLGISIFQYEIEFQDLNDAHQLALLWIIFICTCLLISITVIRYRTIVEFKKSRNLIHQKEGLRSTGLFKDMIFEILLTIPHPNPFLKGITFNMTALYVNIEYYHTLNELLNLLQIGRLIIILRVLLMFSYFYNTSSQRVCSMYAVKPSYLFVIKSIMKSHPLELIGTALVSSVFIFAYAIRICERPLSRYTNTVDYSPYSNSLWNVVVTMTTVGYGDYYPRTLFGRIVSFTMCIWGLFIISIMVVSLTNLLNMGMLESKAYSVIERLQSRSQLKNLAASALSYIGKISISTKNGGHVTQKNISELRAKLNNFKDVRRQYDAMLDEGSTLAEDMVREFELIRRELIEVNAGQEELIEIAQTLVSKTLHRRRRIDRQPTGSKQTRDAKPSSEVSQDHGNRNGNEGNPNS
eukprot:TRINITY_DN7096_c0_g1_i9.p1 TRINITY_DN7096_c0_g1~~TRINITY_DN7096_c0_g1_i9.p1  ORF type:complete len:420 (-),score=80.24 TRINITY_DN7096_c0_g1_i9:81-1340(-)